MSPLLWIAIGAVGLLAVACAVEALAKGNKVGNLRVFTNDVDTFVVRDLSDLPQAYLDFYGMSMEEIVGNNDLSEWHEMPAEKMLKIWIDCDPDNPSLPKNATVEYKNNGIALTAKAGDWAASNGRGFLCSTEY